MKNQYFGDVNDYLKYGLLRCLSNVGLTIGVCWMLTQDDGRSDGRKITYLANADTWRSHDPALFDALSEAIAAKARHIRQAERRRFLGRAVFFSHVVPDDQPRREKWLPKALTKFRNVDLLFFDPDNGIEVQSKPKGSRGSNKYLYWNEIQEAWGDKKSLLIFQHFPRSNHRLFASNLASQ